MDDISTREEKARELALEKAEKKKQPGNWKGKKMMPERVAGKARQKEKDG